MDQPLWRIRRVWGYLIETNKILKNKVEVPTERVFATVQYDRNRGHNMKLFKKQVGRHMQHCFSWQMEWIGEDSIT